ncbi:hypothetical protein ACFL34_00480 [Candidatus Sumerlaeota bacterium]
MAENVQVVKQQSGIVLGMKIGCGLILLVLIIGLGSCMACGFFVSAAGVEVERERQRMEEENRQQRLAELEKANLSKQAPSTALEKANLPEQAPSAALEKANLSEQAPSTATESIQHKPEIPLPDQSKKTPDNISMLSGFKVLYSRFYIDEQIIRQPVIELRVQNSTPWTISRVYFHSILFTPGRRVWWVEDSFSYKIAGGLEPNETAHWELQPNMFGDWGQVEYRSDMQLHVGVIRLDDHEKKEIISVTAKEYVAHLKKSQATKRRKAAEKMK